MASPIDEQLEARGGVAPGADAGHHARPRERAGERRQRLLVPGLHVDERRRRVRPVAVAGQAVAPREQRGAHGGERPLPGAAEQPAVARIGHGEPRAVPARGARRGRLRQHHAGEDLRVLLRERAGERRRRRRAGDRVGEHLHGHPEPGRGDDAVAHAGAQVQRADRRVPHVEDDAAGRRLRRAGPTARRSPSRRAPASARRGPARDRRRACPSRRRWRGTSTAGGARPARRPA